MAQQITKILIANRGEIAMRVIRTAKDMGIPTVSVYSDADRYSPHVVSADQSVHIGPPPSSESYLVIDKIISACHQTGANAVHPGYGFLSENEEFSRRCAAEGITFIGPDENAIRIMGDKLTSKQAVKEFGVPLVPGMDEPITDKKVAKQVAADIGYPVMIKASAGGGGKGMRIVHDESSFDSDMERAMSEARSSFGNDAVFVEKFVSSPKHIEVQLIGDQHGNYVALFERDCSIQRRNQKVIEEAPSAVLTPEKREEVQNLAIQVAKSCDYYGAGTVEFMADEKLNFYFLEMNTRLQVEHPVTEEVSGIDLVREQIRVAEGKELSFSQEDLKINGHSMEVRVYAEDPKNNFLPVVGQLIRYSPPKGPGVRVDDGFEEGMEIPIYYDPMIAKLITHGRDREEARQRMIRAIEEYEISGIETTLDFCKFALQHPNFIDGQFTTKFVDQYYDPEMLNQPLNDEEELVAAIGAIMSKTKTTKKETIESKSETSSWRKRLNY